MLKAPQSAAGSDVVPASSSTGSTEQTRAEPNHGTYADCRTISPGTRSLKISGMIADAYIRHNFIHTASISRFWSVRSCSIFNPDIQRHLFTDQPLLQQQPLKELLISRTCRCESSGLTSRGHQEQDTALLLPRGWNATPAWVVCWGPYAEIGAYPQSNYVRVPG